MNQKEKELVTKEFCSLNSNYNICPGGIGGWSHVNSNSNKREYKVKGYNASLVNFWIGRKHSEETKKKISKSLIGRAPTMKGKFHSEEAKKKIGKANSKCQSGNKNSQFGTMWITNGTENKKIKKTDKIPNNWYKGRKINPLY